MGIAGEGAAAYVGYSYRERCDRYLLDVCHADAARLRDASRLIKYSTVREQIRTAVVTHMELFVKR